MWGIVDDWKRRSEDHAAASGEGIGKLHRAIERQNATIASTTDIQTRFCLAFEMADHKDDFSATNLLKETMEHAGKMPAVFISDGLPSYNEAHQEVFVAKNPLDKHSVYINDSCLNKKKEAQQLSGTVQRDVPQILEE